MLGFQPHLLVQTVSCHSTSTSRHDSVAKSAASSHKTGYWYPITSMVHWSIVHEHCSKGTLSSQFVDIGLLKYHSSMAKNRKNKIR